MQLPDLDYQLVVTALFGGLAGAILTQVSNLLLSAWRQPKLEILFSRAEVGCVTETPVLASGKRGEQRYLRLRVRNVGRSAVHGVNVCVTSIQYFPASGAPVIFTREVLDLQRALSGEIKFDLGRGGYRFVDLFSVTQWPLDNNPAQQHGFAFERTGKQGSARLRQWRQRCLVWSQALPTSWPACGTVRCFYLASRERFAVQNWLRSTWPISRRPKPAS